MSADSTIYVGICWKNTWQKTNYQNRHTTKTKHNPE